MTFDNNPPNIESTLAVRKCKVTDQTYKSW